LVVPAGVHQIIEIVKSSGVTQEKNQILGVYAGME
jgi:hypothetical protein